MLTQKKILFARHFAQSGDAKDAVKKAGYTSQMRKRLQSDPDVLAYLAKLADKEGRMHNVVNETIRVANEIVDARPKARAKKKSLRIYESGTGMSGSAHIPGMDRDALIAIARDELQITTAVERQVWLSKVVEGLPLDTYHDPVTGKTIRIPAPMASRLKACELLCRMRGELIDRRSTDDRPTVRRIIKRFDGSSAIEADVVLDDGDG